MEKTIIDWHTFCSTFKLTSVNFATELVGVSTTNSVNFILNLPWTQTIFDKWPDLGFVVISRYLLRKYSFNMAWDYL